MEKNKEAALYLMEEIIGKGRHEEYKQLHTADFILHSGPDSFNLEQDYKMSVEIRKEFPELSLKVVRVVAEGDFVAVYWKAILSEARKGHTRFPSYGITLFKLENGKIKEEWNGG